MAKIRVFLADDHQLFREGVRSLLSRAPDIEVVGEAGNGVDAVARVRELTPDVVLMDISMPGMNGLDAAAQIRDTVPSAKVIILTVHETDQYVSQMLNVGAAGYIVKSVSSTELIYAVTAVHQGNVYLYPSIARMIIQDYLKQATTGQESSLDGLTARELEILKHVASDLRNKEIADLLGISLKTVQAHRTSLMSKLGLHDRTQLVKYAIRRGLISA
jgi:DNA-binding NarL/FixJ family response regulator